MEDTNTNVVDEIVEAEATENQTEENKKEEQKEEKLFTQDQVNKIIQERLNKEKEKTEEAKKLARMNAEEKAKYETGKKEKELANREKELNKRELTATAKEILADKGLSTELHALLNYESAETVNYSIKNLESAIQKKVEKKFLKD